MNQGRLELKRILPNADVKVLYLNREAAMLEGVASRNIVNTDPGSDLTNPSLECSLSYSPYFSMF